MDNDEDVWVTFRKVVINIPLLTAINHILRSIKFLKDLCVNKPKLHGNKRVNIGEDVSTSIQKKLPTKYKDPNMFTIPCKTGEIGMKKAMYDLGASIYIMTISIYNSLNIGLFKSIGIILQLVDRSNVYLKGCFGCSVNSS